MDAGGIAARKRVTSCWREAWKRAGVWLAGLLVPMAMTISVMPRRGRTPARAASLILVVSSQVWTFQPPLLAGTSGKPDRAVGMRAAQSAEIVRLWGGAPPEVVVCGARSA